MRSLAKKKILIGDQLNEKFAKHTESGIYGKEIDFKVAEELQEIAKAKEAKRLATEKAAAEDSDDTEDDYV